MKFLPDRRRQTAGLSERAAPRSGSRADRPSSRPALLLTATIICIGVIVALAGPGVTSRLHAQTAPPESAGSSPTAAESEVERSEDSADRNRFTSIPDDPLELVEKLDWLFLAPFGLASFIALWFGIERLVILRRGRVIPRPFVERFLQHLDQGKLTPNEALRLCDENGSPVASVFAHGVRKWGKPSVEVEQAIIDGGERQVSQLRKHLRVVNGVATVTPLMGLLGTVIGMIMAFNEIASASDVNKSENLAIGIAVALITTAIGLTIAIPSLILYMYLAGRVDALVMEMDHLAQNVVHMISAEALNNPGTATSRSRSQSSAAAPKKEAV